MKRIIIILLVFCGIIAADISEISPVLVFKGMYYKNNVAGCNVEVMPQGTPRYFDSGIYGEENLELLLIDYNGGITTRYNVPIFFNDPEAGIEMDLFPIRLRVPYSQQLSSVRLVDWTGNAVCEVTRSEHNPSVTIVQPADRGNWGSVSEISWASKDDDMDSLLFDVYIADNSGNGWNMIASDVSEEEYTLLSPAEATHVMVVAKDGFNSGYAVSDSSQESGGVYTYMDDDSDIIIGNPPEGEPQNFSFMEGAVVKEDLTPKNDENTCCLPSMFVVILSALAVYRMKL